MLSSYPMDIDTLIFVAAGGWLLALVVCYGLYACLRVVWDVIGPFLRL